TELSQNCVAQVQNSPSDQVFESERHEMMAAVGHESHIPFPPVPADLTRLHRLVRVRKVTTVELSDVHTFEFRELPLGPFSRPQIEFYLEVE
ncbi:MAG: hypothetical protein OSB68_10190, partial [Dehalococcoidia bacterium]|nr:hypothetical protein [Dehalococcoidia bacterium]